MKKQHIHMTTLITAILTREYDKSNLLYSFKYDNKK